MQACVHMYVHASTHTHTLSSTQTHIAAAPPPDNKEKQKTMKTNHKDPCPYENDLLGEEGDSKETEEEI